LFVINLAPLSRLIT